MLILEALDILKENLKKLTEGSSYGEQVDKMRQLENGTRGFNAKAASDDKLRTNRQICISYNLPKALKIVENEMLARGLITTRTGQAAPQPQPQPQPQPAPYVQPQPTPAEIFLDDFTHKESPKGFVIPTGESDWQAVVEAKKTGDIQSVLKVSGGPVLGVYFLIRRFVIAALLGYADIKDAVKQVLVDKGFNGQIIKLAIDHIIANKDKFKDLLDKYKAMKVESLKKLVEDDESEFDKYIPTGDDFRKVYEAKKDFELNGDDCNLAHNPYRLPSLLLKPDDDSPIIRRFIASALLKWDLFTEQLKAKITSKLKKNKDDISTIVKMVLAKKSRFVNDFIKYNDLVQKIKKEAIGNPEAEIDIILNNLVNSFQESLTEEINPGLILSENDFHSADAFFIEKYKNDPKTLLDNCLAVTGSIKQAIITFIIGSVIGIPAETLQAIKNFLTINASMPSNEIKEIIMKCAADTKIKNRLSTIINNIKGTNENFDPFSVLAFNIGNKEGIYLDPVTQKRHKAAEKIIYGKEADLSDRNAVAMDLKQYLGKKDLTDEIASDEEELEEDVEKHDKLNPKIFENNHLKPEVREKCLEIVDAFAKKFEDVEVAFNIKDIVLTGSNASYNYTKDSDIDIHIIADTSELEDPNKLYPLIYDAYKSIFNSKMDISIYGIPVEIYVETEDTGRVSNGVYSIKNDAWVKEPVETIIPEIDWDEFMKAYDPWEKEYKKIVKETEGEKTIDETPIDDFIDKLYVLRQQGLQNGGEYSFENLIFKELRNRGHLERLKDLKNRIVANKLSLKSLDEAYLDDNHLFFDYKTAEIADDEYIDTKKGSNFSAQDLLDGSTDKAYENLESKIEQVTPKQYFAMCGRIQHQPAEELIKYVKDDPSRIDHLVQVLKVYNKKFPIPYVNFVPNTEPEGQEGKHRMYVLGELFGWDTPFPVQVIRAK